MDTKSAFEQALLLAQGGDKKRARRILREVVQQEPHNEAAWLLFAEFAEAPEQKIAWLEHVLKINPDNVIAHERLTNLRPSLAPTLTRFQQVQDLPSRTETPQAVAPTISQAEPPVLSSRDSPKRSWLPGCGCAAVLGLLAFLCVALAATPEVNTYLNWQAGTQAFSDGNCREANVRFQQILNSPGLGIINVNSQADQLRLECTAFLEAVDEEDAGHFGLALAHYIDFSKVYPVSGLNIHVPLRVASLFERVSVEDLAVEKACDRIALQGESKLIPEPGDRLPEFYYYCARTYERNDDLENAIVLYYFVRTEYPQHPLSDEATQGQARIEIELAKGMNPGAITLPPESGPAPIGTSVYIVQNDSPEQLQIILSGPEVIIEEVAECRGCAKLTSEPSECPNQGPIRRITLKPGEYEVLVKSVSDDGVRPYRGSWTFKSGVEYSECYFVLTQRNP